MQCEAPSNPRVLIITPEVTYLPDRMGSLASYFTAKAGGLADVSAALINALFDQGADVHVAIPNYRTIFSDRVAPFLRKELRRIRRKMPEDRVHLAEDRAFFYLNRVYSSYGVENIKLGVFPACSPSTTFTPLKVPCHKSKTGALMPPFSGSICFMRKCRTTTRLRVTQIPLIF
jgi:hypothetical protein